MVEATAKPALPDDVDPDIIGRMTRAEYLAFEQTAEIRHEYFDGVVRAMAGASDRHGQINFNIARAVPQSLIDNDCTIRQSDLRVRAADRDRYFYPDTVITCEPKELEEGSFDTLLNPQVVIEIVSPSTDLYDRGVKLDALRSISSLTDYLIVRQDNMLVERHTRLNDVEWHVRLYSRPDETVELASIGFSLPLDGLYDRVVFDSADAETPDSSPNTPPDQTPPTDPT